MNRYPDPDATLLRRRIAERYETEPGRIAVGNGSCEILLAAAEALCEPGDEILYAWPSFSMYPYLPALTGRPRDPRAARRGRRPRPRRDGRRGDRRDPAADRLQPEQPDRDPHPGGRDRRLLRADPAARDGHPRRGLHRVPDPRRPRRDDRPARRVPQPRRPAHLQQVSTAWPGLRVGYAIGSAMFRAAVDAVRQPFSVNALAQAAGAEAILHSDDVARRVESTIVERVEVEDGSRRPRPAHLREPGQLLLDRPRRAPTRRRSSPASPSARSRSGRARRWAPRGTCGSPTGPAPRTSASLPRLRSCSASCYKPEAVIRTGHTTSSHRAPGAALDCARYAYYWRFS